MTFNSLVFAVFLPIVFILHWSLGSRSVKRQNLLLLGASYFFYGTWSVKFLFLLIASTVIDYWAGRKMAEADRQVSRKSWFWVSITVNVGCLCFFKYYNFFVSEFERTFLVYGLHPHWTLSIILPVGISFYTFHGLSYIIDLYKGRVPVEKDFVSYALFVGFFPLLVAGPLERATHLLPQVNKLRSFDRIKAVDGLRQILWGLVKKIVIADNCGEFVDLIFKNSSQYSGSVHALCAFFFAFQIYGDFSGYSDIAIGVARLFGIDLFRNFDFPYFSRNRAEFWRRWHMSLYGWFRDYVYIPLGGSRVGLWKRVRNIFVVFLLSGLWHGASWTFVAFGILNAIYMMPGVFLNPRQPHAQTIAQGRLLPGLGEFLGMVVTFVVTALTWIIFRSESLGGAAHFLRETFSRSLFSIPRMPDAAFALVTFVLVVFFVIFEWVGREDQYAIQKVGIRWHRPSRWGFYYLLILCICIFAGSSHPFIYFQF